jgi:hypothetical protein
MESPTPWSSRIRAFRNGAVSFAVRLPTVRANTFRLHPDIHGAQASRLSDLKLAMHILKASKKLRLIFAALTFVPARPNISSLRSGSWLEGTMRRERALKVVLVVVGLLFCAGVYPLTMFFSRAPAVPMIMSIYVALGIFLLLAVRDPAANRSLITFGGWAILRTLG